MISMCVVERLIFKAVSGVLISKQSTSMVAEISKPLKSTGRQHFETGLYEVNRLWPSWLLGASS